MPRHAYTRDGQPKYPTATGMKRYYSIRDPKIRFEQSFVPVTESGCWLWIKAVLDCSKFDGNLAYGRFSLRGRTHYAHRMAWFLYRGAIPSGKMVCHKCDVPTCVNPDHLFLGTALDNVRDMLRKGRHPSVVPA